MSCVVKVQEKMSLWMPSNIYVGLTLRLQTIHAT